MREKLGEEGEGMVSGGEGMQPDVDSRMAAVNGVVRSVATAAVEHHACVKKLNLVRNYSNSHQLEVDSRALRI